MVIIGNAFCGKCIYNFGGMAQNKRQSSVIFKYMCYTPLNRTSFQNVKQYAFELPIHKINLILIDSSFS